MTVKRALTILMAALAFLGTGAAATAADQVIFLVRHAEKAATAAPAPGKMMADDPPLSAEGHARATRLAALLASADVKHIFTTEYLRARQTAAALSERTNVPVVMSAANDPDPLVQQVRKAAGNVLIVGHSNTLPDLLKRLGVTQAITIADSEYDNLFVVVRHGAGPPTLIRLRY